MCQVLARFSLFSVSWHLSPFLPEATVGCLDMLAAWVRKRSLLAFYWGGSDQLQICLAPPWEVRAVLGSHPGLRCTGPVVELIIPVLTVSGSARPQFRITHSYQKRISEWLTWVDARKFMGKIEFKKTSWVQRPQHLHMIFFCNIDSLWRFLKTSCKDHRVKYHFMGSFISTLHSDSGELLKTKYGGGGFFFLLLNFKEKG